MSPAVFRAYAGPVTVTNDMPGTAPALAAAAVIALVAFATAVGAETLRCEGLPLKVRAPEAAEAALTCEAAARAWPRLARCGAAPAQELTIDLVDDLEGDCLGVYHCGEDWIELLSPAALAGHRLDDSPFAALPADVFFDSIVVHELVHAAYDKVPCPFQNCLTSSEYAAYAMQVMSLPAEYRAAFADDSGIEGPVGRDEISAITLLMAPDLFAQKVWAHFSQRPDGCDYVAGMMAGDFYLDVERP